MYKIGRVGSGASPPPGGALKGRGKKREEKRGKNERKEEKKERKEERKRREEKRGRGERKKDGNTEARREWGRASGDGVQLTGPALCMEPGLTLLDHYPFYYFLTKTKGALLPGPVS